MSQQHKASSKDEQEEKDGGGGAHGHRHGALADAKAESKLLPVSSTPLTMREEKARIIEQEQDEEVDEEFEAMLKKPNTGEAAIAVDPVAKEIALNLSIISMNMRNGRSGMLVWESSDFGADMFETEMEVQIPAAILECRSVSREIVFNSGKSIKSFRLEQRVFFMGQCIEEWFFSFGFVIPGSTNTWQQIISAAPPEKMLPAEVLRYVSILFYFILYIWVLFFHLFFSLIKITCLAPPSLSPFPHADSRRQSLFCDSGKVTFETSFFDGNKFLCKNLVRINYV